MLGQMFLRGWVTYFQVHPGVNITNYIKSRGFHGSFFINEDLHAQEP